MAELALLGGRRAVPEGLLKPWPPVTERDRKYVLASLEGGQHTFGPNCVRLEEEFVFLAVILDAYSRRVIGWALDRTLENDLPLAALRMALAQRKVEPGLVHHSDRGVQYASREYIELLQSRGIQISMSRKGNVWDNAACESFMKTLKYEEVYRSEYRDLAEARASITQFLEKIYNQKRLHSALGYKPPAEFEADLAAQRTQKKKEAATRR